MHTTRATDELNDPSTAAIINESPEINGISLVSNKSIHNYIGTGSTCMTHVAIKVQNSCGMVITSVKLALIQCAILHTPSLNSII